MDEPKSDFTYNKLPPILNWKELKEGAQGQPPLPALATEPKYIEKVFDSLSKDWRKGLNATAAAGDSWFVDDKTEELSLACLLLSHKFGPSLTEVAYKEIEKNITIAEQWKWDWLYAMPWRLALASKNQYTAHESDAVYTLVANLNCGISSFRTWILDIAWLVRKWLKPATALNPLLMNVSMSVFGGDKSWVIAATLFSSEEEFFGAVDNWKFPQDSGEFKSDYEETLKEYRNSLAHSGDHFLRERESRCWQIIAERSLGIST